MSSRPRRAEPTLAEYLAAHGFAAAPGRPTWHDHRTPDGIIRVVHEPGEETQLISLSPAIGCRYKAMFYTGTPDAVIIAAVQAALSLPPDAGTQPSRAAPGRVPAIRDTSQRVLARGKAGRDDHR
jgi:hypothetical protein